MQLHAFRKKADPGSVAVRKTFAIMKSVTILLLAFSLKASAGNFSQEITLTLNNAPLEKIFKEIQKQTHYRFVYTKEDLEISKKVSLEVKKASLESVLELCFRDQPITYNIEERFIIISLKKRSTEKENISQFTDISGKIINDLNEPVEGATIAVKGTNNGTSSNERGEFILENVLPNATLIISSVGYQTQELNLQGRTNIIVQLKIFVNSLDETIVIAYGTTTRRFSTGSVNKVSADNIASQPVTNPLAALQGRVPGLDVTSTSGVPGASFIIQIRGQNSINPNPSGNRGITPLDNPLIIIDGVPFAPQNTNINLFRSLASPGDLAPYANPYGGISPFNNINPSDIESIEVLRDASETAIYGSRGANGVIIITTKKGKPGKTSLGINIYTGQNTSTRTMEMLKTKEYLAMRREAFSNLGTTPNLNPASPGYAPELLAFDTTLYTDWKKYFLGGTANVTDINLSVTGGSINTQFLIGSGYRHETYIFPGDFANKRGSVNTNLRHRSANNKLELELSANYSYTSNNSSGTPDLLRAFTLPPNYPALLNSNGEINWNYKGVLLAGDRYANPIGFLKRRYTGKANNLISHFQFEYELAKGLIFRSSLGYNTLLANEISQSPKSSYDPSTTVTASASFGSNDFKTWIIEPQFEYKNTIWKGKFLLLAGGTIQKNTNTQSQLFGLNYPNDNLLGSISSAGIKTATDAFSEYKYSALFARINYILSNTYILNISGRRDGSSRFGPARQFGTFYSVGAGWIFTQAAWFKNHSKWLSYGKLRASYGTTGNDNIGNYQYLSRWAATSSNYSGISGYIPQNIPNDAFSWSVNKKLEMAFDLSFLKNRMTLSLAWFRNRSGNQLVSYLLPNQTGFSGVTANFPALVENSGVEILLSADFIRSKRMTWSSSLVMTIPHNKLVAFPGIENSSYSNIYIVGQSLAVRKGFDYAGVNTTTGFYEFNSKNGLTSTPSSVTDYIVIGNSDKKLFGGLQNIFEFKNFQLNLFLEFVDQDGPNYLKAINGGYPPGTSFNQPSTVLDRWQKPGDITHIQKYDPSINNRSAVNFSNSSGAFSDASYIRFKTFSLSYGIPAGVLSRLKLQTCRVFLNAQNLLTITGFLGNDPENKSFYSIPPLKTVVAGLNITL